MHFKVEPAINIYFARGQARLRLFVAPLSLLSAACALNELLLRHMRHVLRNMGKKGC